jgi:hypothetical protein
MANAGKKRALVAMTRDPVSLMGAALVTLSAILILTLFAMDELGFGTGPYVGIVAFMVLPAFFLLGLVLIPVGIWRRRRKERRATAAGTPFADNFPVLDFNVPRLRRIGAAVLLLSAVNVVILALVTFKGVEMMDSTSFCGKACHSVMAPEYTTYQRSPHSRVRCTECHIGPGASFFVKSKLSGAWQLVSVAFKLYPRPIPAPVHNLRPARDTCETCHWPTKFVGQRLKVISRFGEDEPQTETKTVLLLKVGGTEAGRPQGIHWHVDPRVQIRYRSDPRREQIGDVELSLQGSPTRVYRAPAEAAAPARGGNEGANSDWRTMDCIDCHNRPTHVYGNAEDELDRALAEGRIDRTLPFLKREGLKALRGEYSSEEAGRAQIRKAIADFYAQSYTALAASKRAGIETSGEELARIWATNVFPQMNIKWGTYPSFLGHTFAPGCFRCHDNKHKSEGGQSISRDCGLCHALLANAEENPEILKQLEAP